ncbi:MAG: VCBS repeat-containing protein [Bacteroidales bacterium]|nr:VCBS repeat-containing protein [Bacteroidales bacterium]
MLKNGIILFSLLIAAHVSGQSFTEVATSIQDNASSSISWGDYDNDNDLDILISGSSYTKIYRNNGNGIFSDINADFQPLIGAASDWGDYDNDGDLDLVLAGKPNDDTSISFIYRNDNNTFTDIQAELPGFGKGSAEWGDFDNDGDLDLLMCGEDERLDALTKIYINKGNNEFTPAELWLPGVSRGSASWGDFDNDHDLDILICGRDISSNSIAAIYINDGDQFTDIKAGIKPVQESTGIWCDYDSDGDPDIFISGSGHSIVYENTNNLFVDINADIFGLNYAKASWGDFDQNGLPDLLIAGSYAGGKVTAIFRYNYGKGFTLYDSSFIRITSGDVKCADYDNDNDLDLVLTGYTDPRDRTAGQYRNNIAFANTAPEIPAKLTAKTEGNSVILSWCRSSDSKTPSRGISYNIRIGTTAGGIDVVSPMSNLSTGKRRIVSSGNASSDTSWIIKNLPEGKYFWSVQAIDNGYLASPFASEELFTIPVPFTSMRESVDSVFRGSVAWGDYDNDRDFDLAITGVYEWSVVGGQPKHIKSIARVYRNDLKSHFTEVLNFQGGLYHSNARWGDYDNDGDLDLLMTGEQLKMDEQQDTTIAMIYQNNGNDVFTKLKTDLEPVYMGTAQWVDLDNDGDLDILLSGGNHDCGSLTKIYRNDRNNYFTEIDPGIYHCAGSQTVCFDADNDGDYDMMHLCNSIRYYLNKGNFLFEEAEINLPDASFGLISYGDYDNDRDLDLLLAGKEDFVYSRLFDNKKGIFNETENNIRGVMDGSACFGDYDVDGDLDFLLTGQSGRYISMIYLNNGDKNTFTESDYGLEGIHLGDAQWGDYDNDGDLDIALNGFGDHGIKTKIYRNNGNWHNAPPKIPDNPDHEIKGFDVILKWDHCTDGDGKGGVTYNVRVDTIPGGGSLTAAMSDMDDGYRLLPAPGNAGVNNFYIIRNLPFNKYYWSVQAVDNTYKGGSWSGESSFELGNVFVDFESDTACLGSPTTFTDLSQSREGPILSWHWDFSDGGTSDIREPEYYFSQAGEINVTLTIVLSTGSYYISKKVVVKPKPNAQFSYEPVSEGGEVMSFENKTDTFDISITEWEWDFGDSTNYFGKNPPQHGYLTSDNYTVKLSVTGSNGCSDMQTEEIEVCLGMLKKPELRAYGPNIWYLVCSNDTANYYKWYYNDNQLFNANSHIYVAGHDMGEYQVAISSDNRCYVSSDRILIPVTGSCLPEKDRITGIFPNPNDGRFHIRNLRTGDHRYYYKMIDMNGVEISDGSLWSDNDSDIRFDYRYLANGLYFLEIYDHDSRIYLWKFFINK